MLLGDLSQLTANHFHFDSIFMLYLLHTQMLQSVSQQHAVEMGNAKRRSVEEHTVCVILAGLVATVASG